MGISKVEEKRMEEYDRYAEEELRKNPDVNNAIIKRDIIYEFMKHDIKKFDNKDFFYELVIPVFNEIIIRRLKIRSLLILLLLYQKHIEEKLRNISYKKEEE